MQLSIGGWAQPSGDSRPPSPSFPRKRESTHPAIRQRHCIQPPLPLHRHSGAGRNPEPRQGRPSSDSTVVGLSSPSPPSFPRKRESTRRPYPTRPARTTVIPAQAGIQNPGRHAARRCRRPAISAYPTVIPAKAGIHTPPLSNPARPPHRHSGVGRNPEPRRRLPADPLSPARNPIVIPAKAGIHTPPFIRPGRLRRSAVAGVLDSGRRRNDGGAAVVC